MASVIKIKRSSTQGAVPNGLQVGELAVNLYDRKLYVGNSSGVTAIGGEDFRLTTQDAGEGAYIKLLGDSILSTNSVLVRAGSGISVTKEGNGSISIAATGESSATEAAKLSTPRRISLGGDVTGWSDFDGSANVTITATIADDSHSHVISNVDGLQDAIDGINTNLGQRLGATSTVALTGDVSATATAFSANAVSLSTTLSTSEGSTLAGYMQVANTNTLLANYILTSTATSTFVDVSGDTMTGALTLHDDPTQALHAATKRYVDDVAQGIVAKPAVVAATTANLSGTYDNGTSGVGATLNLGSAATLTIDGVTSWSQYDGILVKDQSNAEENGRYIISQVGDAGTDWILARCGLCDEADEIPSSYVFVQEGSTYAGTGWVANVDDLGTFTVGTDSIDWIQFSGAGTYLAGRDLEIDGTTFNLAQTITANTTGNAATATQLETARTIGLGGDVSGSASFDGSSNITITATVADDSHNHVISNVDGLQDAIDGINTNLGQKLGATSTVALTGDVTATATAFSSNAVSVSTTLSTAEGSTLATYMQVANVNSLISDVNTNLGQKLGATATVTLTGDVTGTASFSANAVTISTTYNNDVVLGTDTSGNYVATISGTANEIEVTGSGSETAAVTIGLPNDVTIGNDLTVTNDLRVQGDTVIDGNLTVEGALTYISTSTVYADDGMFKLAANNAGDAVDTGIYAKYIDGATTKYAGYFRDATDGVFKFYTGLQSEPSTTVDTSGTGYTVAQIDVVIDGGSY